MYCISLWLNCLWIAASRTPQWCRTFWHHAPQCRQENNDEEDVLARPAMSKDIEKDKGYIRNGKPHRPGTATPPKEQKMSKLDAKRYNRKLRRRIDKGDITPTAAAPRFLKSHPPPSKKLCTRKETRQSSLDANSGDTTVPPSKKPCKHKETRQSSLHAISGDMTAQKAMAISGQYTQAT